MPPEVLSDDIAKFEANGTAATEIGLPMQMILGQLPSGKVEIALQDLIPHFPPGFLQPTESIASYLPTMVNLPLMDVVMRIPPDLLALRADQKDVDAAVINMADPFTEEILREQAESARRQTQPNIIEESQAPQEEFVPRDQQQPPVAIKPGRVTQALVPPRRPAAEPLMPGRGAMAATTLAAPSPTPPAPPLAKIPPPPPVSVRESTLPRPTIPAPASSISGRIQLPSRPAASVSGRIQPPGETPFPASASAPVPPVPRHTGPIPAPPPPRHTTSLPVPRRTGSIPALAPPVAATIPAPQAPEAPAQQASVPQVPAPTMKVHEPAPSIAKDSNADDLQRLAALAMAELGETGEVPVEKAPEAVAAPVAEPEAEPVVETPAPVVEAVAAPVAEPAEEESSFIVPPSQVMEPIRAPAPAPEPIRAPAAEPQPAEAAPISSEPDAHEAAHAHAAPASVAFNLNTCTEDDLGKTFPDAPGSWPRR